MENVTLEEYKDVLLEQIEDINLSIYDNKIEIEKMVKELDEWGLFRNEFE